MRPATCRHDPGCGSELACIQRGAYEGESYRRQADARAREEIDERYWGAVKRGVVAFERIAAALEERLPPIEDANKIEALQTQVEFLTAELKRQTAPDLGVACKTCGKPITGIGAIAGAMNCTACHMKSRGL